MPITLLRDAIYRVCGRDATLKWLKFTNDCYDSFLDFEQENESDDDDNDRDSVAEDNLELLRGDFCGEDTWYESLGGMIGSLPYLKHFAFEKIDPEREELRRFWGEVQGSRSIRTIECIKMDMTNAEEFLIWFDRDSNVKNLNFEKCRIGANIGYYLSDGGGGNETTNKNLRFDQCDFRALDGRESIIDFCQGLGGIKGLSLVLFKHCQFKSDKMRKMLGLMIGEDLPPDEVVVTFII